MAFSTASRKFGLRVQKRGTLSGHIHLLRFCWLTLVVELVAVPNWCLQIVGRVYMFAGAQRWRALAQFVFLCCLLAIGVAGNRDRTVTD